LCLLLKKVASLFCPDETWETSPIFKDFPGLINKIQGLFRTAKKNPGLSKDAATLYLLFRKQCIESLLVC